MANQYEAQLRNLAAEVLGNVQAEADHFAAQTKMPPAKIMFELMELMDELRPKAVKAEGDGRAQAYRVRLTLYRDRMLYADTDPELPANQPGTEVVRGLISVSDWAREIMEAYHNVDSMAFDILPYAKVEKSIKSLRPSLSRNGGIHNWRMSYTDPDGQEWLANILVVTEHPGATTA